MAEPRKTPQTTRRAARGLFFPVPTPSPAKIATNERMVSGLVRVSKNVETYAPRKPVTFEAVAARSAGLVSNVLQPR